LNMKLVHDLITRTRVYAQLGAVGGMAAVNLDSVCMTLVKLSHMACELPEIAELDINPLIADAHGVVAVDARVVLDGSRAGLKPDLAISPYPAHLQQTVTLPGFAPLLLRPIRPEDEPALQAFVAEQSPEAIRLRFFTPMAHLPHQLAARLSQIDYDREMAFILVQEDASHTDILGVVRLHADPDGEKGEYAVMISPRMIGRGIGGLLMGRLIDYARERGIGLLYGDVLAENKPMLALARRMGFGIRSCPDDMMVKFTELEIR
jgi:acetyltransferase